MSHALLPAFTLAWRLDVAETIGSAAREVVAGGGGAGPPGGGAGGSAVYDRPRLVRRFRARAAEPGGGVRGGGGGAGRAGGHAPAGAGRFALTAIGAPLAAAASLPGWAGWARGGSPQR